MVMSAISRAMAAPSLMAMPVSASDRAGVDAVAHHQDSMPLPAEPGHILSFVRRKDSGAEVVHSHLGGNGRGGTVTVAGKHDGTGDPQGAEGR